MAKSYRKGPSKSDLEKQEDIDVAKNQPKKKPMLRPPDKPRNYKRSVSRAVRKARRNTHGR